ncbi:trigger factor [Polymorphobacter sp.]|uniref:trigger factor n=1 Tax=Polymorphobacter sp. TaxID=1909290 RepID=UPI003F71C6F9
MQISETLNQGLRREFSLVIPAASLAARVDARLAEVSKQIRMPGFRPGKVPPNLVRKMHGAALHGEALQAAVNESVQALLTERQLRPAIQPQVDFDAEPEEGQDVAFKVALEVLPTIETIDIDTLTLEKLVVPADDAAVDAMVERLASQQQKTEAAPAKYKAKDGDTVVIDFIGKVEGTPFDGGTGEGMRVKLGSGMLIPGFEEQLVGVKANDEKTIEVTFPSDYGNDKLSGKPAQFSITVQGVETPVAQAIDDEFAKGLGIDSLEALREILKDQVEAETVQLTRTHLKRKLLDTLASRHDFEVPETMVTAEFDQIWAQLEQEVARSDDADAARADIEKEREDYRRIAERRVRLGLLLSEIGNRNNITVSQAEMNRLIGQEATRYPGEQQKVVKFFQENAMAAAQLRAPLYEDKVVDFLIGKADLTERTVSRADLEAAIEDEDESPSHTHGHVHGPDCDHDHDHDHDHGHAKRKAAKATKAAKPKAAKAADAAAETAEPAPEAAEAEPVKAPAKPKAAKAKAAAPAVEEAEAAPAKPKRAAKKTAAE